MMTIFYELTEENKAQLHSYTWAIAGDEDSSLSQSNWSVFNKNFVWSVTMKKDYLDKKMKRLRNLHLKDFKDYLVLGRLNVAQQRKKSNEVSVNTAVSKCSIATLSPSLQTCVSPISPSLPKSIPIVKFVSAFSSLGSTENANVFESFLQGFVVALVYVKKREPEPNDWRIFKNHFRWSQNISDLELNEYYQKYIVTTKGWDKRSQEFINGSKALRHQNSNNEIPLHATSLHIEGVMKEEIDFKLHCLQIGRMIGTGGWNIARNHFSWMTGISNGLLESRAFELMESCRLCSPVDYTQRSVSPPNRSNDAINRTLSSDEDNVGLKKC